MNTKEQVLALLLQAEGESVSGEQTARAIGVSRNAL
jgi:biotin operon repressor